MDHDKLKKWLEGMHIAPCLILDDFGKNKFSERVEAEIFDLVEYRTSHELPLFITTNETPDTLKARMSADRGEPLLRRLFEFCDVITF
jgi:DNA replication protein DnaC